jgi:hypothetical protein
MPLDRRLRDAFDRAASAADPDVELHLEQTIRRASRPRAGSVVGTVLAASAATVAFVVLVRLLGAPSGVGGPSPSAEPSLSSTGPNGAVVGTYSATLGEGDAGVVTSGLSLVGTWTMTLHPSGVMELAPPASFEGSRASGHTYSLDGSTLRTDLYYNDYCSSIGAYAFEVTADGLALTVTDDACEIRRTILATREWVIAD